MSAQNQPFTKDNFIRKLCRYFSKSKIQGKIELLGETK